MEWETIEHIVVDAFALITAKNGSFKSIELHRMSIVKECGNAFQKVDMFQFQFQ